MKSLNAQAHGRTAAVDWRAASIPGIDRSTVVVVLGGGGAIGGQAVRAFAALGAQVVLATRSVERSRHLAAEVDGPGSVHPAYADLADSTSLATLVTDLQEHVGLPNVLVNAAGAGLAAGSIESVSRTQLAQLLDVNVLGTIEAVKAFAPALRSAGGGRIINVASASALRARPGRVAYSTSKAAIVALTEHLAVELAPDRITVNVVSPGLTPTALREIGEPPGTPSRTAPASNYVVPLERAGTLDDYAAAIVFLSSSLASYVTGVNLLVDGGSRLVRAAYGEPAPSAPNDREPASSS